MTIALTNWGAVASVALGLAEDDREGIAFFEQKIRPVLVEHCYKCHSAESEKLRGGLRLDLAAGWQRGGDSGEAVIVPGDPAASLLIQSLQHADGYAMPPDAPLPAAVVKDFVAWVKRGAPDPRTGETLPATRADASWWSLQPVQSHPLPAVASLSPAWQTNPIDVWIGARLAAEGLTPSSPAAARELIRRMTYDVTGLPPTHDEVTAFASAYQRDAEAAVTALADRLLASPHYGEHWGRHWLDVVRFGESVGFERNVILDDLWPFRDYVIRSLNDDRPFHEFIREHLAGDLIASGDPQREVGAAFLVMGPYDDVKNQDAVAQAHIRAATLDDVITATSSAFLGLTVNCARCHHHKFDPIPSEDYYRLRAAFEGLEHGRRVVATPADREAFNARTRPLNAQKKRLTTAIEAIDTTVADRCREHIAAHPFPRPRVDPNLIVEEFPPVTARWIKLVLKGDTGSPSAAFNSRLVEFEAWTNEPLPRNVALASAGATAAGAQSTSAEELPSAYSAALVIDGEYSEQWIVGRPSELLITLARPESIVRTVFGNARGIDVRAGFAERRSPCEYEILTSLDGQDWQPVASGDDREPWTEEHGIERLRSRLITADEQSQRTRLQQELAGVQAELSAVPPLPTVWIGNHAQPKEPTRAHVGGDPARPGDVIAPASLEVLARVAPVYELAADAPEGDRRIALANWVTAPENPLTWRVLANRVWQYHFGTGLVDTPSDFGFLGGQPTHPELLDELTRHLAANGYQLKALHRLILCSQTYRQSAADRADAAAVDGGTRLLWRFPPRRLASEELRDTLLSVAGVLQHAGGGPGFRLYHFAQNNVCTYVPLEHHDESTYRRAVYHQNARASVIDLLSDFDLPDNAFAAPVRANTTTPLQALTLLNHSLTVDLAAALAERVRREAPTDDPASHIATLYRVSLQREPNADEQAAAAAFAAEHGLPALCRAMFNLNELLYLE